MVIGLSDAVDLPPGVDALALIRRFEPVLHFTEGEMFFPMRVDDYLQRASLWSFGSADHPATLLVDHGRLGPETLAATALAHPDSSLFLRYAPRSLQRRELHAWRRRSDRPKFTGVSRLAAVGMLGRIIDSGMRLSLTLRGKVPGGLTAAAQQQYALTKPARDAYHAHVSTDGGYVIIQYWFLYAMNDWRSSFSGVNDHESDWEQVTVYLAPPGDGMAKSAQDYSWRGSRSPRTTRSVTICAAEPMIRTSAGSRAPIRWSTSGPARIPARTSSATTWCAFSLRPWPGCSAWSAAPGRCCSPGPETGRRWAWASRTSTIAAGTGHRSGPGRSGRGLRSSSTRRLRGSATSGGCGGWTPPTLSVASALQPAPAMSAQASCGPRGPIRSPGQGWTRCRPPLPPEPGRMRRASPSWTRRSPSSTSRSVPRKKN